MCNTDYDKIMLTLREKYILYRILKKQKVPYSFCTEQQCQVFLNYELITIDQKQKVISSGRVVPDTDAPKFIHATDKTLRYFLYTKDSYFKGKLPVIIALIALIKSFDVEICWLANLIKDLISKI